MTTSEAIEWIASLIIYRFRGLRRDEADLLPADDPDIELLGVSPIEAEMIGRLRIREVEEFVQLLEPELSVAGWSVTWGEEVVGKIGRLSSFGFVVRRMKGAPIRHRLRFALRLVFHLIDEGFEGVARHAASGVRIGRRVIGRILSEGREG